MDFRTFLAAFIEIPAQILTRPARTVAHPRLHQWLGAFFRLLDAL